MYTHEKKIITRGKPLAETGKALIMVHGRGATAESILQLSTMLTVAGFSLFAPQATRQSWYPYSFMAPTTQNEPALTSALDLLAEVHHQVLSQGIESRNIYLLGFSQGACLASEFAARHAQRFGGLILFTGGLIGQTIDTGKYTGNFEETPVLITTGDPDAHVPVSRVNETAEVLTEMGAIVTKKIYPGRPHTILPGELGLASEILSGKKL